jgi:CHASE1-domain containing sensor protein
MAVCSPAVIGENSLRAKSGHATTSSHHRASETRDMDMKFAFIGLLLFAGLFFFALSRRRAAARDAQADALARSRAARRPRVPTVSNNLKGVTASQTIEPVKLRDDDGYRDDR